MPKISWKSGTMIYPLPAVMVSCGSMDKPNIITIAWTGILNTNPPMTYISVRKERYSHGLISSCGVFAINLVSDKLCRAMDYCGVRSGRDEDKFKILGLHVEPGGTTGVPTVKESPLNMECRVREIKELGSHDMFIADIISINVDESNLDKKNKLHLDKCNLVSYLHGKYYAPGRELGHFGFSVKKQ